MLPVKTYYAVKPLLPRRFQLLLRRILIRRMLPSHSHIWPIDQEAKEPPKGWKGWPKQKKFALVLTHDVDTSKGQDRCKQLVEIEQRLGFRSSVFFVPERYQVCSKLRNYLIARGFEVGVHGLNHDGKLYTSKEVFQNRAVKINQYTREWNAKGFRSPSMHCNLDWLRDLEIEYDASTFDTDPFEPRPHGVGTIFPFRVPGNGSKKGYVELPYTLPQDFTLFALLKEKSIAIWRKKLDWIAQHGGMALLNTHPDYMNFNGKSLSAEEYPIKYYIDFLEYVKKKYGGQYWHVLPEQLSRIF